MNRAQINFIKKLESLDKLKDIEVLGEIRGKDDICKRNGMGAVEVKAIVTRGLDYDGVIDYIKKSMGIKPTAFQIEPKEISVLYDIDKKHAVGLRVYAH